METHSKTSATKRIFLVRHGEGTHNATGDGSTADPLLTKRGQAQAAALRGHLHLDRCTLVVVSPLSRAVQTAAAIFGEKPSARTVLTPLHSERWSAKCDEGRPKTALVAQFAFLKEWDGRCATDAFAAASMSYTRGEELSVSAAIFAGSRSYRRSELLAGSECARCTSATRIARRIFGAPQIL